MPKQLKVSACLTFVLAMLFYLFFQISKHNAALAHVNAFADDPYDAVGSFSTQLAVFTALLSLVRAFRPYQSKETLDGQKLLLLRSEYLCVLSVTMTLVADVIAMIRHPTLWIGLPAGQLLAMLVGGLALVTAFVGWLLSRSTRTIVSSPAQHGWTRAIVISTVSILILALYPENWRQSIFGALLTILVGMILFIVSVWAWEMAISPSLETQGEDFIDDLTSVYRWLKAHVGPFVVLFTVFEKVRDVPFIHSVLRWLNPRKHTWSLPILIGIVMGGLLVLAEAFGEGSAPHQIGRFAIIAAVFISLECFGVLLGYAFLAKPLELFRRAYKPL